MKMRENQTEKFRLNSIKMRKFLKRFGQKEYELTLTDPVAFHKWILGIKWELSLIQKTIMRSFAKYPETLVMCGSKAGKSTLSAELVLWRIYKLLQIADPCAKYNLNPGTNIYCMSIAPKEDIAKGVMLNYIENFAGESWYLSDYIVTTRENEVEFIDNIIARSQGSSSRAGRGYQIYTLILDEFCHFIDTKGNLSGTQVVNAFMPRLLPFGKDGRFIGISTSAGRSGAAYEMFEMGTPAMKPDGSPWVIQKLQTHGTHKFRAIFQAPTWEMNPLYPRDHSYLIKEFKRDPWFFKREYGAEFADVVSPFFEMRLVEKILKPFYIPPQDANNNYVIVLDPGLKHDHFALAMGHIDKNDKMIVDLTRSWKPTPGEVINMLEIEKDIEDLCSRYKVTDIVGDERMITPTLQRLENLGMPARGFTYGTTTDMKIYQNLLERINEGPEKIIIQDAPEVRDEFRYLQRIVLADRFRVQAGPGSHDDLSDAIALLTYILTVEKTGGGVLLI